MLAVIYFLALIFFIITTAIWIRLYRLDKNLWYLRFAAFGIFFILLFLYLLIDMVI